MLDMAREYEDTEEAHEFAQRLREWVEEFPEVTAVTENASFVSDLLSSALREVHWTEIARAWIYDAQEARTS
jgi:hypothetical protein